MIAIKVYLDNGVVCEYDVQTPEQAREHAHEIIKNGYRSNDGRGDFTHWPPHKIVKVKAVGDAIPTSYPDRRSGT